MKMIKLINVENGNHIGLVPLYKWRKVVYAQDGLKAFSNGQIAAIILNKPELSELLIDAIMIKQEKGD